MINSFLFDLDGTLVDSIPDLTKSVNLLRAELGLEAITSQQVRSYVGDGVGLLLQRALPAELFNPSRRKRFMEIYTKHLTDETIIYPGIIEFLEAHQDKPMAVVTNKPQHLAEIIIDRFDLNRFFPHVIGAELALQRKPHPDMVNHAVNLLQCDPASTVMLGDHHVDLRAASAGGVKSCFCAWGLGHDAGLTPDYHAETTGDLAPLFPGSPAS
jgi:phosphoglycolate phosphatase